jgi:hypothetical protein
MESPESSPTTPKPKLRWFQFSLGGLLAVVTLCAIPCSWLAVRRENSRRETAAVSAIRHQGGYVERDIFENIEVVDLSYKRGVIDAGLKYLARLIHLQTLYLSDTEVTDSGLVHIEGLSDLRVLHLRDTQITDAGLENLRALRQLQDLDICGTNVTDAGVAKLQQALPNCKIVH